MNPRVALSLFLMLPFGTMAIAQSDRPTVKFINNKTAKLLVFYVPDEGDPVKVDELEPGKSCTQLTTIGHRFLIRDSSGNLQIPVEVKTASEALEFGPTHSTIRFHGWKIHLNDQLWVEKPKLTQRMLDLIDVQLDRVVKVIPEKALEQIRTVPIWLSPPYEDEQPTAAYHPSAGWLKANGRLVEMAKSVEVTNVDRFEFEDTRMPYLMLHELAHAYHDQVLGFRNSKVRKVFEIAKASGGYDRVDRFTGRKIVKDKAYGMNNPKEYFAESTEAYFGKNDFYPFNRSELKAHDPQMHDLVAELWGAEN